MPKTYYTTTSTVMQFDAPDPRAVARRVQERTTMHKLVDSLSYSNLIIRQFPGGLPNPQSKSAEFFAKSTKQLSSFFNPTS